MNWTNWPINSYTGMVVTVAYDLKFAKDEKNNIVAKTKGLVLNRCWFESPEKGKYEVYHVHFYGHGGVYVDTDDLDIIE